jgi:hypothetical protein
MTSTPARHTVKERRIGGSIGTSLVIELQGGFESHARLHDVIQFHRRRSFRGIKATVVRLENPS